MHQNDFRYEDINVRISGPSGDWISECISRTSTFYEIDMLEAVAALNIEGTYVDVGSQIGNHAVYFARFTKADFVWAIEPNPASYAWLLLNIEQNSLAEKISPINVAAGSMPGSAHLDIPQDANSGMAKIGEATEFSIEVDVSTLDSLIPEFGISLLKIDVEGHELQALKGAEFTLRTSRPHVFIEAQSDPELNAISDFLADLQYVLIQRFNATPTYHFAPLEKHPFFDTGNIDIFSQINENGKISLARCLTQLTNSHQCREVALLLERNDLQNRLVSDARQAKNLLKARVNEMNSIIVELKQELQNQKRVTRELEQKYLRASYGLLGELALRTREFISRAHRKVRRRR